MIKKDFQTVWQRDGAWLLVWSVLLLLPMGHAAELPILIASLLALWFAWRDCGGFRKVVPFRLCALIVGAYVLPEWISAIDSVAAKKSWSEAILDLRFLPFFWFVCYALRDADRLRRFSLAVTTVILFWVFDALAQSLTGHSLGGSDSADRLSGVFGPDNLKLGPTLAVLSPLLCLPMLNRYGKGIACLTWIFIAVVILLAGSRAAWVSFFIASLIALFKLAPSRKFALIGLSSATLVAIVTSGVLYQTSEKFAARVDRTAMLLQGDESSIDHALAFRLPIWRTAVKMIEAHPMNGVGVRAFRFAYPKFSAPDDRFAPPQSETGAYHAHQLGLELLSETGVIGLCIWIFGFIVLWRHYASSHKSAKHRALPLTIALIAMLFPINTHLAFYSAYWGLLMMWLLAIWVAALHRGANES